MNKDDYENEERFARHVCAGFGADFLFSDFASGCAACDGAGGQAGGGCAGG